MLIGRVGGAKHAGGGGAHTGADADHAGFSDGKMLNRQALLDDEAVFGEPMLLELGTTASRGAVMIDVETSVRG